MSYTMTLDIPQKAAVYVGERPQLRKELQAIFVAIVTAKMQSEGFGDANDERQGETPGPSLLNAIREADEIADGRRNVRWFKSIEELAANCLA